MHKRFMRSIVLLLCLAVLFSGCSSANVVETEHPSETDGVLTEPDMSMPFHIEEGTTPVLEAVDIHEVYGDAVSDNYLRLTGVQALSNRMDGYPDELVIPLNAILDDYIVGVPVWVDGTLMDVIIWRLWSGGVKVLVSDYASNAYTYTVGSFPQYFVSDISSSSVTLKNSLGETVSWLPVEYYDDALGDFTDMIAMSNPFGTSGLRNIMIDDCYFKMASDIGVDAVYEPLIDDSIAGFIKDPYSLPSGLSEFDMALCIPYEVLAPARSQVLSANDYVLPYLSSGSMPVVAVNDVATGKQARSGDPISTGAWIMSNNLDDAGLPSVRTISGR